MSWLITDFKVNETADNFKKFNNLYYYSTNIKNENGKIVLYDGIYYNQDSLFYKNHESFLNQIDGSFSICVLDNNNVFCASDVISKKNTYYYIGAKNIIISSSLKSIIDILYENNLLEINNDYFIAYCLFGNNTLNITPYKNVYILPHGHYLDITDKNKIKQYWFINKEVKNAKRDITNDNKKDYLFLILESTFKAIFKDMPSDNNIISELSGGFDSSILLNYVSSFAEKKDNIMAYSITHKNTDRGNEEQFMDDVIKFNSINNHYKTNLEPRVILDYENSPMNFMPFPSALHFYDKLKDSFYNCIEKFDCDTIFSGKGGDLTIGDSYHLYIVEKNLLKNIVSHAVNDERYIFELLYNDFILPFFGKNRRILGCNDNFPHWLPYKNVENTKNAVNEYYNNITKGINNMYLKRFFWGLKLFSGASDSYSLLKDNMKIYHPYLGRNMIVFSLFFNDRYPDRQIYREKLKLYIKNYLPDSVYNRNHKSGNYHILFDVLIDNKDYLINLLLNSELISVLNIDIKKLINEIKDMQIPNLLYIINIISIIRWYDSFIKEYPAINKIKL